MISPTELNPHNYPVTPEIAANLAVLLDRINQVRTAYGAPMTVTSGLRSDAQQKSLIAQGLSNATHSHHLVGQAVDILDKDGAVYDWCRANEELLAEVQLWLEERQGPWQHFQTVPPGSGKRWFFP